MFQGNSNSNIQSSNSIGNSNTQSQCWGNSSNCNGSELLYKTNIIYINIYNIEVYVDITWGPRTSLQTPADISVHQLAIAYIIYTMI